MTEFGKTELMSVKQLEDLGLNAVIWPVTTFRIAMGQTEAMLRDMAETGTQVPWLDKMQHRSRLCELVRYDEYNQFDQSVFTYSRDTYSPAFEQLTDSQPPPENPAHTRGVNHHGGARHLQGPQRCRRRLHRRFQGQPGDKLPVVPGYPVQELAEHCTFEEVAFLLRNGELPLSAYNGPDGRHVER